MKVLIGIAGCHKNQHKADALRATWVKDVRGADVRFFAGGQGTNQKPDEVWLDCPDDYDHRLPKVYAMFDWALTQGYDYLWKVDDDVYLRPERLLALPLRHFQGNFMPHQTFKLVGTILGACAGFSRHAMETVLREPLPPYHLRFEDVFVTLILLSAGIEAYQLKHVMPWTHRRGGEFVNNLQQPPHPNNQVVASFEYTPEQLVAIHEGFMSGADCDVR